MRGLSALFSFSWAFLTTPWLEPCAPAILIFPHFLKGIVQLQAVLYKEKKTEQQRRNKTPPPPGLSALVRAAGVPGPCACTLQADEG